MYIYIQTIFTASFSPLLYSRFILLLSLWRARATEDKRSLMRANPVCEFNRLVSPFKLKIINDNSEAYSRGRDISVGNGSDAVCGAAIVARRRVKRFDAECNNNNCNAQTTAVRAAAPCTPT